MRPRLESLIGPAILVASAAIGCTRATEKPAPVHDDLNDVAKASQKVAKDLGASGEDTWITTKVKSALASEGFDPVHVHVDTESKVVTLSGTVDSAAKKEKAVGLAKGVTGVVEVNDHLFVKAEK